MCIVCSCDVRESQTADEKQVGGDHGVQTAECVYCTMFLPDVVIPESAETYVKLTEQTLRSSTGRQQQTPSMPQVFGARIDSCTLSGTSLIRPFTGLDFDLC